MGRERSVRGVCVQYVYGVCVWRGGGGMCV